MKKQLVFAVTLVLALVMSSCNKDLTALDPSLFTCTPNPLIEKGGKVDATITGTFPVKYFAKNATVVVTPVMKFDGKEVKGAGATFQGEKVVGNNKTITYKAGGNYTINTSFDYVPGMAKSELVLQFAVSTKKKTYNLPEVKIADGVNALSQLALKSFTNGSIGADGPAIVPDKFQRVIQEKQEADIMFLIQRSNLRRSQTKAEDVVALTKKIAEAKAAQNEDVSSFEISGYASPDGPLKLNTNLAEKRQKVTSRYINRQLRHLKASVQVGSSFTSEDWDGFKKLMENSNIQDKDLILRVLKMYSDSEQREREIKNLSSVFKVIAKEILPQLRRSRLQLTVDVTGKSDEQIDSLAKADPSKLNVEELLYAATLTKDLGQKADIYKKVIAQFPNDLRGYNNLGAIQYEQGNIDAASANFTKALSIYPKCVNAHYNLGLCDLAKGNVDAAEVNFGKASGTRGNLENALGTVYMLKGDYAKAKTAFGKTITNNHALFKLLENNLMSATDILNAISQPTALTAYLKAIVGTRSNLKADVYKNLREAVSKDPSFKAIAANDIEFSRFSTDDTFKSIVK